MSDAGLRAAVEAWLEADPDPSTRSELAGLLAAAETDGAAAEELRHLFDGRLSFGTAGLRAPLGAGPARMNRVVVRSATAAVMATLPAGARVVVAHDARRNSDVFAADAAALVAAAGGEALFLGQAPTPVAAHAVVDRGAQAGIVITASHNPPGDNGYKLYGADGVQIVPPTDAEVEGHMATAPLPPRQLPAPSGSGAVRHVGPEATERYLAAITRRLQQPPPDGAPGEPVASTSHRRSGEGRNPLSPAEGVPLRVVYTPLHGVGATVLLALFERLGLPAPAVVASQAAPDGDFPTVAFPNPEEPGALDAAYAVAAEQDADLVIANDPDADRLAVAVPAEGTRRGRATPGSGADRLRRREPDTVPAVPARITDEPDGCSGWRRLTGDELGVLLADYLLRRRAAAGDVGEPVLLAASVVSSQMLGVMAADAGVAYAETLTGFKWIARAADGRAERLLFGYEEALGYAVCDEVRDKDGISAAALLVQLVVALRAEGSSLADRLDDLARRHGVHATGQVTVRFPPAEAAAGPAATTDRLRRDLPADIAGQTVVSVIDYLISVDTTVPIPGPATTESRGRGTQGSGPDRLRRREPDTAPVASARTAVPLPPTDMLVFALGGGDRVIVRPSGTEPKLKVYIETVEEVSGGDLAAARNRADRRLRRIAAAMQPLVATQPL